jgi:HK97 family phage prohead protease
MRKLFATNTIGDIKSVDSENRILRDIVLSTGSIDRHGESLNPKGWKTDHFMKNPVLLWGHCYEELAIGRVLRVYIQDNALKGDIEFDTHEKAEIIYQQYLKGIMNAFSVGFIPLKFDETGEYTYAEMELLELSAVTVPANAEALAKVKSVINKELGDTSNIFEKSTDLLMEMFELVSKSETSSEDVEQNVDDENNSDQLPETAGEDVNTDDEHAETEIENDNVEVSEESNNVIEDVPDHTENDRENITEVQEEDQDENADSEEASEKETVEEGSEEENTEKSFVTIDQLNKILDEKLKQYQIVKVEKEVSILTEDDEVSRLIKGMAKHLKKKDKNVGLSLKSIKALDVYLNSKNEGGE